VEMFALWMVLGVIIGGLVIVLAVVVGVMIS
jgi:hypothetical protein